MTVQFDNATLHWVRVSPKTCWCFVQLRMRDGRIGQGEATLNNREDAVAAAAAVFVPQALAQATPERPGDFAAERVPANLAEAAVISALDQALWELHALGQNAPLAQALAGGKPRDAIGVYANINRRTLDRSPAGFAASAQVALAAGHAAFKMAPFDELNTMLCAQGQGERAMQPGLARIAAVRAAVGPDARLMVDCHWRFDEPSAMQLITAAASMGLYWIECPLPEVHANIAALARLRDHASALGVRQAGLEECIRWEAFRPYCEAGAYDVVMPDVKYVGGMAEMLRLAQTCARLGVQVSPHNPSGPICHAASLQLASRLEGFDLMELQFDESPLFDALVSGAFGSVRRGSTNLPSANGLGVKLDPVLLQAHAARPALVWKA
ncbi:MAG: enolase C-terminal domain-like protein [Burkholderiaceae bacterium]